MDYNPQNADKDTLMLPTLNDTMQVDQDNRQNNKSTMKQELETNERQYIQLPLNQQEQNQYIMSKEVGDLRMKE